MTPDFIKLEWSQCFHCYQKYTRIQSDPNKRHKILKDLSLSQQQYSAEQQWHVANLVINKSSRVLNIAPTENDGSFGASVTSSSSMEKGKKSEKMETLKVFETLFKYDRKGTGTKILYRI